MRRLLGTGIVIAVCLILLGSTGAAQGQDTPAAKRTRARLKEKISIDVKDTRVKDVLDEIRRRMNNKVSFKIDNASGVSNNTKLTYKDDNKTLAQVLDEVCTLNEMGYVIFSRPGDRYDGSILIRKGKGKEAGYEGGRGAEEGLLQQALGDP